MIITRAPMRLPLGGGGTDLPSYYEQFGGQLITASIDKYVYIAINEPPIPDKFKLHYSQIENTDKVGEIKHNIIRETLKYYGIESPMEITSISDFGAGTGMGSSSAFTVALVSALDVMTGFPISKTVIADLACEIEINRVQNPIGKQDQYASAFGGINELVIEKDGEVVVTPLEIDVVPLEERLLMFYTGIQRDANMVLREQGEKTKKDPTALRLIHEIGKSIKDVLLAGDIDAFGELMNAHWKIKRSQSENMSSREIDDWYAHGLRHGAIGGKLMGAGGGGLLLFCSKSGRQDELKRAMADRGLKQIDFKFEFQGVKLLYNGE